MSASTKDQLTEPEVRVLAEIRRAGPAGVLWNRRSAGALGKLLKTGLIECRFGPTVETDQGRTGMRFVAVRDPKIQP